MKVHRGSPVDLILCFFEANPEEDLTREMAEQKFSISRKQFDHAAKVLSRTGEIEYVRVIRRPGSWK